VAAEAGHVLLILPMACFAPGVLGLANRSYRSLIEQLLCCGAGRDRDPPAAAQPGQGRNQALWSDGPRVDPGPAGFFTLAGGEPRTCAGERCLKRPGRLRAHHGDKLWNLLPAAYRASDSEIIGRRRTAARTAGADRASMAVVRRSIDRLWGPVDSRPATAGFIPYLAELLATTSCPAWTERGQRLDVANISITGRPQGRRAS